MILLPSNYWGIKQTAYKGRGIYACKRIPKGTVVGDYLGIAIDNLAFDFEHSLAKDYVMYYQDLVSIIPDNINSSGAHCINHSCYPNCWIYPFWGHTLIFALRDIAPFEELTIHYLLSPKADSCNTNCTHICKCESKNCSGSMHLTEEQFKIWQEYYENESHKTPPQSVVLNQPIEKLDCYPSALFIPVNLLERITGSKIA